MRWAKQMLLAFADDSTVHVFESVEQANVYCEVIDVENQEYTFLDERGCLMKPANAAPVKRKFLYFFSVTGPARFTLQSSDEKREDLVRTLATGELKIVGHGSCKASSLDDLLKLAPLLVPS